MVCLKKSLNGSVKLQEEQCVMAEGELGVKLGLPELGIQKRKGIRVEIGDRASDGILKGMAIADQNGSVAVNEGKPAGV
ncbi:hypothetical protein V6N11_043523 [Hibiscus sabdariffa]|uniref:Uncharacterized protein n=1 Tax=Hibiscus sabdariffa TaxID=183260 RepID=A0ABR2RCI0_9ROSI